MPISFTSPIKQPPPIHYNITCYQSQTTPHTAINKEAVTKSGYFTIYSKDDLDIHTIYCLNMPFCNSPYNAISLSKKSGTLYHNFNPHCIQNFALSLYGVPQAGQTPAASPFSPVFAGKASSVFSSCGLVKSSPEGTVPSLSLIHI